MFFCPIYEIVKNIFFYSAPMYGCFCIACDWNLQKNP